MKCPHCGNPVKLVKSGVFPVEGHKPPDSTKQTYLPVEGLDAALEEYAEDLEFAQGEGIVIYAPKEFFKDKSIWIAINKIIKAHGGKWITAGEGSHWEVCKWRKRNRVLRE